MNVIRRIVVGIAGVLVGALVLALVAPNAAGARAAKANWKKVEALPTGTLIEVKADHSPWVNCFLQSATDDELRCLPPPTNRGAKRSSPSPAPQSAALVLRRQEVREIRKKDDHLDAGDVFGYSALFAGMGAAIAVSTPNSSARDVLYAAGGAAAIPVVGGAVGLFRRGFLDLFHRNVIYKRRRAPAASSRSSRRVSENGVVPGERVLRRGPG